MKSELSIKIYGEDPNKLQALSDQIVDMLKKMPGAADVGTEELLGQPQVQITVDRAAIARYGLSVSDVQTGHRDRARRLDRHAGARGRTHV